MSKDQIDKDIALWRETRPDLDISSFEIVGRIPRIQYFIERNTAQQLEAFAINTGEFEVLAALYRIGVPYQLSPKNLQNIVLISSGALTNRINRLEEAGLVTRAIDQRDRRGIIVTLTDKGLDTVNQALGKRLETASGIIKTLSSEEQASLAYLLKKLLFVHEK